MPAPSSPEYSVAAKVAAHTALRDLLNDGSLRLYNAADTLLCTIGLADPCGTVDSGTGQLTITPDAALNDVTTAGTAAWGGFFSSAGTQHLAMACEAGTSSVAGKIVISSLAISNKVESIIIVVG